MEYGSQVCKCCGTKIYMRVEHAMSFHLQRCSLVLFPCALFDVHGGIPEQPLVAA